MVRAICTLRHVGVALVTASHCEGSHYRVLRSVICLTRYAKGNAMSDLVSMSRADLATLIAAEVAKAVAAQSSQVKSDFKFVITSGIPSKSGRKWATVEITDQRTGVVTTTFVDRFVDGGKRKDGAAQEIIYASIPAERKPGGQEPPAAGAAPAPSPVPAPVAPARVKATRKAVTA